MSNEEYKEYIIEMIQKINNPEHLKRIFNYVHKFFIRRGCEKSIVPKKRRTKGLL